MQNSEGTCFLVRLMFDGVSATVFGRGREVEETSSGTTEGAALVRHGILTRETGKRRKGKIGQGGNGGEAGGWRRRRSGQ